MQAQEFIQTLSSLTAIALILMGSSWLKRQLRRIAGM